MLTMGLELASEQSYSSHPCITRDLAHQSSGNTALHSCGSNRVNIPHSSAQTSVFRKIANAHWHLDYVES